MDKRTDGRIEGQMDDRRADGGRMARWMGERGTDGRIDGQMEEGKGRWRKNGQMDGGKRDRWTDRQACEGWVSGWMEGRIGGRWESGFPVSVCPVLRFQPDGIPQACSRKLGRRYPELWCQRILTTSRALIFIEAATGRPA